MLVLPEHETLNNLMIEIAQLSVSRVFLFKEQTYRGRCLVAYKDHVNDLNELSDEDRNAFMAEWPVLPVRWIKLSIRKK